MGAANCLVMPSRTAVVAAVLGRFSNLELLSHDVCFLLFILGLRLQHQGTYYLHTPAYGSNRQPSSPLVAMIISVLGA